MQYLAATLPLDRRMPGGMHDRWGAAPFGVVLCALVVVAAVLATVLLVRSSRTRPALAGGTAAAPAPATAPASPADTALAHLRVRYARGEVDRETFLRTSSDLGAPVIGAEPPFVPAPAPPASPAGPEV